MTPKTARKRISKFESETAEALGGRRTPASGAGDTKGDGRVQGRFRIENKTTAAKGYRLTKDTLQKIDDAARPYGERPILIVQFEQRLGPHKRFAILEYNDFLELVDETSD